MDQTATGTYEAVIVGAGFGGLATLQELLGRGRRVTLLEAADDVGGVWHWNRYPGARVDTASIDYSFSFSPELEQEWTWSERYAGQPELARYFAHVVERFGLAPHIRLRTRVTAARYDEAAARWTITTDTGQRLEARFLVMAVGLLSAPMMPRIEGLDSYEGRVLHTGHWPADGVELAGRRVGVIGTGSSGVQLISAIAPEAERLYVFQRTANHVVPSRNRPMTAQDAADWKANVAERRAFAASTPHGQSLHTNDVAWRDASPQERRREYERRWEEGGFNITFAFNDVMVDAAANASVAAFVRDKMAEVVRDPATAARLTPADHPIGTKRLCVGSDYLETFNRDDVELVDAADETIERLVARGIRTTAREIPLDVVVFATGYDAGTGAMTRIDIRGRGGVELRDKWHASADTYVGLAIHGFPNLFSIAGQGSSAAISNLPVLAEFQARWIADLWEQMDAVGAAAVEAERDAERAWVATCDEIAEGTVYAANKRTWFWGGNVPGKRVQFASYLGGVPAYRATLEQLASDGYRGFRLD